MCFQDVWKDHCSNINHVDGETINEDVVSNVFFELANAPSVSYRLETPPSLDSSLPLPFLSNGNDKNETKNNSKESKKEINMTKSTRNPVSNTNTVVIQQDVSGAAQTHTGGIVWETSYLLLNFLLSSNDWLVKTGTRKTILEIGAGCGMLGLSLQKAFELGIVGNIEETGGGNAVTSRVVLTETNEVMDNLRKNFEQNHPSQSSEDERTTTKSGDSNLQHPHELSVEELDWTRYQEDCDKAKIKAGSIDCIVGTDVVFSTRFVRPMLETMRFLSHPHTTVYLCLQERCRDSHELLLGEAINYGFRVEDISETVYNDEALVHTCGFGRILECKLLKFTVADMEDVCDRNEKNKSKKKKKEKKKIVV